MDVRRIEEEVDPDFLLDAHSRTGLAESGDSCESKNSSLNLMGDFVGSSCVDSKIPFHLSVADTSKSVGTVVVILKLVRLLDILFGYLILSLASPACTILMLVEKVCHEEMVKMPLVDLKVLEVRGKRTNMNARSRRSTKVDESKLCDIPVRFSTRSDKFNVYGDERVAGIVVRAARNNMGNEPILALPEGSDNFVVMWYRIFTKGQK
ncbi:hypothetical protein Tco_0508177 [Tanacetum coccineum]